MLDAVAAIGFDDPVSMVRVPSMHQAFAITFACGAVLVLNCLGSVAKTFHLSVFGGQGHVHVDLHDNFTAFRRTLGAFLQMVRDGIPPIDPEQVINTMCLIQLAQSLQIGQEVKLVRHAKNL